MYFNKTSVGKGVNFGRSPATRTRYFGTFDRTHELKWLSNQTHAKLPKSTGSAKYREFEPSVLSLKIYIMTSFPKLGGSYPNFGTVLQQQLVPKARLFSLRPTEDARKVTDQGGAVYRYRSKVDSAQKTTIRLRYGRTGRRIGVLIDDALRGRHVRP